MDIGNALNVLVSLLFVYLLLALLASVFEELVAGAWNSRGRGLRAAIGRLLGDAELTGLAARVYDHPLIAGLIRPSREISFLPWLSYLLPVLRARQPSYIDPKVFTEVLTDILQRGGAFSTGNTQPALAALWRMAGQDVATFRTKLAAWYEEMTARQGGAYKRGAQRSLFAYGLVLAVFLNVDTLTITKSLWENRASQDVADIAAKAAAWRAANPALPAPSPENTEKQFAALLEQIGTLKLPMGWDNSGVCPIIRASLATLVGQPMIRELFAWVCGDAPAARPMGGGAVKAANWLGWILTALAVALGAQFWFDLLGKVVALRSSGRRPPDPPVR